MCETVVAPPVRPATRSRAATCELWMDRLARFPTSGLTVAQFCAIEAVSLHSFYFWKRRRSAEGQATTGSVQSFSHFFPRQPLAQPARRSDPAIGRCRDGTAF